MSAPVLSFQRESGSPLIVDIPTFLETRALAQGSSGSGKTTLLFDIVQQMYGAIQVLIVDKEGQFAKLREKYDFLLVGPDGELPLDMRKGAIELLLRKVLEQQVNVIWDLSELPPLQQKQYVARLVREAAHLPARSGLWEQMRAFIIDEIQHFAPQGGKIANEPALDPMIEFLSLSRKRGFCPIGATVRVERVDKNVTDMLENRLVGRSGISSSKEAARLLDFDKHGQRELTALGTGSFYAYGPALSLDPVLVRSRDDLKVRPRRRGELIAPPATPRNVKKVLAAFEGFTEEVKEHAHSVEELRAQNADLRRRLQHNEKTASKPVTVVDDKAIARAVATAQKSFEEQLAGVQRDARASEKKRVAATKTLRDALEAALKFIINITAADFNVAGVDKGELEKAISAAVARASQMVDQRLEVREKQFERLKQNAAQIVAKLQQVVNQEDVVIDLSVAPVEPFKVEEKPARRHAQRVERPRREVVANNDDYVVTEGISRNCQELLDALAWYESIGVMQPTQDQVAAAIGVSRKKSTWRGLLAPLRAQQLINDVSGGRLELTDEGRVVAKLPDEPPTLDELHGRILDKLSGATKRVMASLFNEYPDGFTREKIAEIGQTDVKLSTFRGIMAELRRDELIDESDKENIRAAAWLFPDFA